MFALVLLQQSGDINGWMQLATQFGGMGLLAYFLLRAYQSDRKASEERYEKIAMDFREIVQENTTAITSNTEVCRTLTEAVKKNGGNTNGAG